MGNIIYMNQHHCIFLLPDASCRASDLCQQWGFVCGPMPSLMAGVVTSMWFSQLLAEFHTYTTPILKLAKVFVQTSSELLDCVVVSDSLQ